MNTDSVIKAAQNLFDKCRDIDTRRTLVFWGVGKRFDEIIGKCGDENFPLRAPDFIMDSTRQLSNQDLQGYAELKPSQLEDLKPEMTTIIITAGTLELFGEVIRRELYYFDVIHVRSVETASELLEHSEKLYKSVSLLGEDSLSSEIYLKRILSMVHGQFADNSLYTPGAYFGNGICELPSKGKSILFAGAFNGKHVQRFLDESPHLQIYAFEPNPLWADKTRDRFETISNVTVTNALLGSRESFVDFDPDSENHGLSARIESKPSEKTVSLPQVTLDGWFYERNRVPLGQIALDVEGAETEVLKGSQRLIIEFRPVLTICLYHNVFDYTNIIPLIETLLPDMYKYEVRHHSPLATIETVLYATPK